jgi:hypothetical protein
VGPGGVERDGEVGVPGGVVGDVGELFVVGCSRGLVGFRWGRIRSVVGLGDVAGSAGGDRGERGGLDGTSARLAWSDPDETITGNVATNGGAAAERTL